MSIVFLTILITCGISIAAFNSPDLMSKWIMYPYAVRHQNQWYRFITSGFLHANWMHLFFNMYVLYSFGQVLSQYFDLLFGDTKGIYYFILLYVGGIIVSDLPSYIKYHNSPSYRSLGASGAISAVVFSVIFINPLSKMGIIFIPIALPGVVFGGLYLAYTWYMAKRGGDRINHDAHFYGALFGIAFTILLKPSLLPDFIDKIMFAFSGN